MKLKRKMLASKLGRITTGRGIWFLGIIGVIYLLLFVRLFYMQIYSYKSYERKSNRNSIKTKIETGYRGKIYSKKGKLLATNIAGYRVIYLDGRKVDEERVNAISKLLKKDKNDVSKNIKYGVITRYTKRNLIFSDISRDKAYELMERNDEYPYLEVEVYPKRKYPLKKLGSHIIGYVRTMSNGDYERLKDDGYTKVDIVGKQGIEREYEKILRGENGYKYLEVDARNKIVDVLEEKKPKMGADIYLTVDFDLQKKVTDFMVKKRMKGAFVAIDTKTGKILTMVSNPEYPLNVITSRMTTKQWNNIMFNRSRPLENRVITGRYPPGSIFKVISALAFLEDGLDPKEKFFDPGYFEVGHRKWRSWKRKGHGYTDLTKSLVESVNYYYYRAAAEYGKDKLLEVATAFGIGEKTGIDIPGEKSGTLPNDRWKKKRIKENWYTGDTINLSIGQGYLLVTPLQMAKTYAILANLGETKTPHLVDRLVYKDGEVKKITGEDVVVKYKKKYMREIRSALIQTVEAKDGTAKKLRTKGVRIAAKTGSAQNSRYKETHSWIAGFFPAYKPEISFACLVEGGGSGGAEAAEVSKVFIDSYLEQQKEINNRKNK